MTDGQQCTGGYNTYRGHAKFRKQGESDRQTLGTEEAAKRKHVFTWTLSIPVARPPAECTYGTLHALQRANSSLASH